MSVRKVKPVEACRRVLHLLQARTGVWKCTSDAVVCVFCAGRSHRPWCWYAQACGLLNRALPVARKRKARRKA